ncbi:hypothetical protein [Acinetobacter phage Ab69]|nr:hypothetical protein [Acinetobacter phage Ab69]
MHIVILVALSKESFQSPLYGLLFSKIQKSATPHHCYSILHPLFRGFLTSHEQHRLLAYC